MSNRTKHKRSRSLVLGLSAVSLLFPAVVRAHIVIEGSPEFVAEVEECLEKIDNSGGQAAANVDAISSDPNNIHTITEGSGPVNSNTADDVGKAGGGPPGTGSTTEWDPDLKGDLEPGVERDPCASLAHELTHAADANAGTRDPSLGHNKIKKNEIKACGVENEYREANGLPKRTEYDGKKLP